VNAAALAVFAGLLLLSIDTGSGRAAGPPAQEEASRADHRIEVDARSAPWNAVAKIQTNIGTKCTGVLIAPTLVLTAAHCLYNRRTRALLGPGSLHVLFGFRQGSYLWHGLVTRYVIAQEFDGEQPAVRPDADWARLELGASPPGIKPLPIAGDVPLANTPIMLPGFSQDRSQVLLAERCRTTGILMNNGRSLLTHNCATPHGTSGAPLLMRHEDSWTVVGLNVGRLGSTGLALPVANLGD